MKAFLFIIALAFNIFLCCHPFGEHSQNTEPSEKANSSAPTEVEKKVQREPEGLAYSDMLKNKASHLQRQ